MEALKFKVGDKVRVKSLDWYNSNKDANGLVYIDEQGIVFDKTMANLCGKIVQIEEVNERGYFICGNVGFFEDWMLEYEVINEAEKQENKNSMETKEMTKEEVFEYLKNTKILCTSTEETAKVQEKLLNLGIRWMDGSEKVYKDNFLLFIHKEGVISYCSDIVIWMKDNYKQIEPSEILSIKLKEEKPKFDPKSLRPFDKVLVRNSSTDIWRARFFDLYVNGMCETASGEKWVFCIPYNEETKHLHYNANRAPEFYIGGEDF